MIVFGDCKAWCCLDMLECLGKGAFPYRFLFALSKLLWNPMHCDTRNENHFHGTIGPLTKGLCMWSVDDIFCYPRQAVKQKVQLSVNWGAITSWQQIWYQSSALLALCEGNSLVIFPQKELVKHKAFQCHHSILKYRICDIVQSFWDV